MGIAKHLSSFPPCVCRLLAGISNRELAARSGLSLRTVIRIATRSSWDGVTVRNVDRFFSACNLDPLRLGRPRFKLKRMLSSKNGLYGTKGLRMSKKLPLWKKGNRAAMMRSIMKAIMEE